MRVESFGDVRADFPKGAMGLMQIMPETWAGSAAALRSRPRSLRSARQHHRRCRLSARAARPVWLARLPRGLQRRSRALGRPSRDRPPAAHARRGLPRSPRSNRRRRRIRRRVFSPALAARPGPRRRCSSRRRSAVRQTSRSVCTGPAAARSQQSIAVLADLDRPRRRSPMVCSCRLSLRERFAMSDRGTCCGGLSAQVCVGRRVGTGTRPTDGKGKAPPSGGRKWLVEIEILRIRHRTACWRSRAIFSTISMPRAPSLCLSHERSADDDRATTTSQFGPGASVTATAAASVRRPSSAR